MSKDPHDFTDPAAIFLRENYAMDETRSRAELPSPEHHFRIAEGLSDEEDEDGVTTPLHPLTIGLLALLLWLLFAAVAGIAIALIVWLQ